MDKKRSEVHLYFEMYERAIILIFELQLLISVDAADIFLRFLFVFDFTVMKLPYYTVLTKLSSLIVKTNDC